VETVRLLVAWVAHLQPAMAVRLTCISAQLDATDHSAMPDILLFVAGPF